MNQSSLSELETLNPLVLKGNSALRLNFFRMINPVTARAVDRMASDSDLNIADKSDGNAPTHLYPSTIPGAIDTQHRLDAAGGFTQQDRMIRDKRRTLDRAVQYSYQGAYVRKYIPDTEEVMEGEREYAPVRALINANKLKADYDEKIISIGYEYQFAPDRMRDNTNITVGTLFASIGITLLTLLYSYLARNMINYELLYGGLANVALLMAWLYCISFVFVIGLALNYGEEKEKKYKGELK